MKAFSDIPFTLALSSGFFGFYAHVGFLKALNEVGLEPQAYSGSSAGAIIGAFAASGMRIKEIESIALGISREHFWDPTPGLGLLRGRKLQDYISKSIGSDFSVLKKPLRISVFDIASGSTKVFSSGNLGRIVRASCAVPLMFHPVNIDRRLYWDGGIFDKMGIHDLLPDERILSHYLKTRSRDLHSIYERNKDDKIVEARKGSLFRIQLKGLPSAGPFQLKKGPEIIEAAYRKSLEKFVST